MKWLFILFIFSAAKAAEIPLTPLPVFLRSGYSTILEFDEAPVRVVLGDSQSFQVERLNNSLVVKTLSSYAASNLFVYFKDQEPRLFALTASEEAEPTYYKKFESMKVPVKKEFVPTAPVPTSKLAQVLEARRSESRVVGVHFDEQKDYLTVDVLLVAGDRVLHPNWELVRVTSSGTVTAPSRLWAERKEVQKGVATKARFIFTKPNLPRNLIGVVLVVPLLGEARSIVLPIGGGR